MTYERSTGERRNGPRPEGRGRGRGGPRPNQNNQRGEYTRNDYNSNRNDNYNRGEYNHSTGNDFHSRNDYNKPQQGGRGYNIRRDVQQKDGARDNAHQWQAARPNNWNKNAGRSWGRGDNRSGAWGNGGQSKNQNQWLDNFWHYQKSERMEFQRTGRNFVQRKTEEQWKAEELELFCDNKGISAGINFDQYDNIDVTRDSTKKELCNIKPVQSFYDLGQQFKFPDFLVKNLKLCGYSKPTPVQKYAMPPALLGHDIMCCAQTGSGKTAAFLLPVVNRLVAEGSVGRITEAPDGPCDPTALVLSPTRELCLQIYNEARKLTFRSPFVPLAVYGGSLMRDQVQKLALTCDIIIATPGRLTDFLSRGVVSVVETSFLVLDEADCMLNMGFEPQIRDIIEDFNMPQGAGKRQTSMFSATFPVAIQKLALNFMSTHVQINVGRVGGICDSVQQEFRMVGCDVLVPSLMVDLGNISREDLAIVFVPTKNMCRWLTSQLRANGLQCDDMHGDKVQQARELTLRQFKNKDVNVMVATDVMGRGLDISDVNLVINVEFPKSVDDYVHRVGRTGRIGHSGRAITITNDKDLANAISSDVVRGICDLLKNTAIQIPEWMSSAAAARKPGVGRGGAKRAGGGRRQKS